jgi:L-threonylcarbamoyladenylate synthase
MIEQEIERSYKTLKKGGIILYPTDTIWGIGCDATNKEAVKKIYSLKKRSKNKALIILIAEYTNLYKLIDKVSPNAHKEMNNEKPTTVIFNNVKNVSKEILAEDGSAAIRLANDNFCQRLIIKLGQPIVSTSANISGGPNPEIFTDINNELKENVDYIVNLRQDEIMNKPSSIVKINPDGSIKKIR